MTKTLTFLILFRLLCMDAIKHPLLGDLILNTLNEQFRNKLNRLEKSLDLCNELFSDSLDWEQLTDEDRLRFAYYVMKAFQKV